MLNKIIFARSVFSIVTDLCIKHIGADLLLNKQKGGNNE